MSRLHFAPIKTREQLAAFILRLICYRWSRFQFKLPFYFDRRNYLPTTRTRNAVSGSCWSSGREPPWTFLPETR